MSLAGEADKLFINVTFPGRFFFLEAVVGDRRGEMKLVLCTELFKYHTA